MRPVFVETIMSTPVYSVPAEATGADALREMRRLGVKKILVRDGPQGLGVLTAWTIRAGEAKKKVRDLALGAFKKVPVGTEVRSIERDLAEYSAVYVQDPRTQELVGVVTAYDLARAF